LQVHENEELDLDYLIPLREWALHLREEADKLVHFRSTEPSSMRTLSSDLACQNESASFYNSSQPFEEFELNTAKNRSNTKRKFSEFSEEENKYINLNSEEYEEPRNYKVERERIRNQTIQDEYKLAKKGALKELEILFNLVPVNENSFVIKENTYKVSFHDFLLSLKRYSIKIEARSAVQLSDKITLYLFRQTMKEQPTANRLKSFSKALNDALTSWRNNAKKKKSPHPSSKEFLELPYNLKERALSFVMQNMELQIDS